GQGGEAVEWSVSSCKLFLRTLATRLRRHGMLKRIVSGAGSLGIVCLLVFLGLAWRPAIAIIDPPAASNFPDEWIAKGKVLAGAGYCVVCHTRAGGKPFAGGSGVRTPFGM